MPDCSFTAARIGISASAWPRTMIWLSLASRVSAAESKIAAEQASSAVSMARTSMRGIIIIPARGSKSDRANLGHIRHEMAQQVLDAVLEGRGRGRAARACALHGQEHDAVLEAAEGDV